MGLRQEATYERLVLPLTDVYSGHAGLPAAGYGAAGVTAGFELPHPWACHDLCGEGKDDPSVCCGQVPTSTLCVSVILESFPWAEAEGAVPGLR